MEKLSRRDFLRASAVTVAGAMVAACAKTTAPTATPRPAEVPTNTPPPTSTTIPTRAPTATPVPTPVEVKEAPQVSKMVADGKIPPLDERLPQNPLVVQMDWQKPGKYGGRQRTYHTWLGCQEESMYGYSTIRYVDDGLGIESGLADVAREYTLNHVHKRRLAVDTHMHEVFGIELKVQPGTTVRNNLRMIKQLTRAVRLTLVVIKEHAR